MTVHPGYGRLPVLKEKSEAAAVADREFDKVKKAKLAAEREKALKNGKREAMPVGNSEVEAKAEKQRDRERSNRASAAASRARMVVYCKDLEKRVDRLEEQRNVSDLKAQQAIRKVHKLSAENSKIKKVLRKLYDMKLDKVTDILVKTDTLLLLAPSHEPDEHEGGRL